MAEAKAFDKLFHDLQTQKAEPFKPCAWYNADGDALEVYLSPEPHVTERINTLISVFVAPSDRDEVLGFVIKNIKRHFGEAGVSSVEFMIQRATVRLLLMSALTAFELSYVRRGVHPEEPVKVANDRVKALLDDLGDAEVDMQNVDDLVGSHA